MRFTKREKLQLRTWAKSRAIRRSYGGPRYLLLPYFIHYFGLRQGVRLWKVSK